MPKAPSCNCGKCVKCRNRDCVRMRRAKVNEPMPWPPEYFTLQLRASYSQYFGEDAHIPRARGSLTLE